MAVALRPNMLSSRRELCEIDVGRDISGRERPAAEVQRAGKSPRNQNGTRRINLYVRTKIDTEAGQDVGTAVSKSATPRVGAVRAELGQADVVASGAGQGHGSSQFHFPVEVAQDNHAPVGGSIDSKWKLV